MKLVFEGDLYVSQLKRLLDIVVSELNLIGSASSERKVVITEIRVVGSLYFNCRVVVEEKFDNNALRVLLKEVGMSYVESLPA